MCVAVVSDWSTAAGTLVVCVAVASDALCVCVCSHEEACGLRPGGHDAAWGPTDRWKHVTVNQDDSSAKLIDDGGLKVCSVTGGRTHPSGGVPSTHE